MRILPGTILKDGYDVILVGAGLGGMAAAGLRWRVLHIADLITCRMYHGGREAFDGFAKNFFAAFDFRLLSFSFVFFWLAVIFWEPLIVLTLWVLGRAPEARP